MPRLLIPWVIGLAILSGRAHADDPRAIPSAPSSNSTQSSNEFAADAVLPVPATTPPAAAATKPVTSPGEPIQPGPPPPIETTPIIPSEVHFKVRGRIEADEITGTQDRKDQLLYGNFGNVVGFRRARLGAEGDVGEQTRWVAEFDFAGGVVAFRDMYMAVNKLPWLREVRVGNMREPFSLEGYTSSRWFSFTERSPANALDPTRNWGVGFFSYSDDERIVVQAGAFRSGTNSTGTDVGDDNDMAFTGRLTGLPWYEENGDCVDLFHIGGAFSQRYAKNDVVTFQQGPQSSLLQTGDNPLIPFVPNITVPANQSQLFNLQAALVLGPLSFQAEWEGTRIEQIGGGPVFLQGGYVFASYFITGEHREYDKQLGTFGETHVRSPFVCMEGEDNLARGPGAWELTARWAYLNFDSPNLALAPNGLKVGNSLTTLTLGVNWYLSNNARLMFNYVRAIPVDPNFGSSSADSFTIRTAIFW